MSRLVVSVAILGVAVSGVRAQEKVNPDARLIADFESRVSTYMDLHKKIQAELPIKPTNSAHAIAERQRGFAHRIRSARAQAKAGDLFAPPIAAEFRRLIGIALGADATRIRTSLKHAEPVVVVVRINQSYPANVPLQSTPPSLLANLPALPPGLEYRIVGRALVLRDVAANLIIDFVPDAIA